MLNEQPHAYTLFTRKVHAQVPAKTSQTPEQNCRTNFKSIRTPVVI